jgi:hypothetical protein
MISFFCKHFHFAASHFNRRYHALFVPSKALYPRNAGQGLARDKVQCVFHSSNAASHVSLELFRIARMNPRNT